MGSIDLRKLDTFRVVAQTGKISHAAKLLHLSQPAVTAQIRALEEECGRPLLQRSTKGVVPNVWGVRLLDAAKQVHDIVGAAESAIREELPATAEVVIGASMTTSAYVLPPLLAGYRTVNGRVPFRLQVSNTARVLEWVAEGRVALGLVEGATRSSRVHLERYLEDELVPVAASSARDLCGITRAAELGRVPLLLREPGSRTSSGTRARSATRVISRNSVALAAATGTISSSR